MPDPSTPRRERASEDPWTIAYRVVHDLRRDGIRVHFADGDAGGRPLCRPTAESAGRGRRGARRARPAQPAGCGPERWRVAVGAVQPGHLIARTRSPAAPPCARPPSRGTREAGGVLARGCRVLWGVRRRGAPRSGRCQAV